MTGGKVIAVVGPTASGKTRLAVELARKYNGEVISADSVSVYKRLDVGSAKPTEEEKRGVRHYMIDVADIYDDFSVSDYERLALPILRDVISRGKTPIICGGTGFYVNSLIYGLSYGGTGANLQIREKYEEQAKRDGKESVWLELKKVDEQTAEKLHPNDLVRVIRALEIYYSTGRKKSDIKDELKPRFDCLLITTTMPREVLYQRINDRVDYMYNMGLETEVRQLISDGVTLENQCMQGIGYKETYAAIENGAPFPFDEIKQNSRRYAKRQITFFKKYNPVEYNVLIDGEYEKLCKIIDRFLTTSNLQI